MHTRTLELLLCLACLAILLPPAAQGFAGELKEKDAEQCECSIDAVEDLLKKKGLNHNHLAATVLDAISKSYSSKERLASLVSDKIFDDYQTAKKIVDALEKSSTQLSRLDEIINRNALRG